MIITEFFPTIIFYAAIFFIVYISFYKKGKKVWAISFGIISLVSIVFPILINTMIMFHLYNLKNNFPIIDLSNTSITGNSITFEIDKSFDKLNTNCSPLCENLLLNNTFKKVAFKNSTNEKIIRYSLKQVEGCENEAHKNSIINSCLERNFIETHNADYLYKITKKYYPKQYKEEKALGASIVMTILQVYDNRESKRITVYQKPEFQVNLFKIPLQVPLGAGLHSKNIGYFNPANWFSRYSFSRDYMKKNIYNENRRIFKKYE